VGALATVWQQAGQALNGSDVGDHKRPVQQEPARRGQGRGDWEVVWKIAWEEAEVSVEPSVRWWRRYLAERKTVPAVSAGVSRKAQRPEEVGTASQLPQLLVQCCGSYKRKKWKKSKN
jgi:hypothetical protein